jgi:hypothetical protein
MLCLRAKGEKLSLRVRLATLGLLDRGALELPSLWKLDCILGVVRCAGKLYCAGMRGLGSGNGGESSGVVIVSLRGRSGLRGIDGLPARSSATGEVGGALSTRRASAAEIRIDCFGHRVHQLSERFLRVASASRPHYVRQGLLP